MNLISFDRAYCLYPHATLELRAGLVCVSSPDAAHQSKYTARGWTFATDGQSLHDTRTCIRSWSAARDISRAFTSRPRWIADRLSWVLRLPLDGVAVPPGKTCDPCYASMWQLSGRCARMQTKVRTRLLRVQPSDCRFTMRSEQSAL